MRLTKLSAMTKGWFVGNFEPNAFKTSAVEVAIKTYAAGEREAWHYHKISTEITCITNGTVEMCERQFAAGDIIILEPGEGTAFHAITDATTVVVKVPGALPGATLDKYFK